MKEKAFFFFKKTKYQLKRMTKKKYYYFKYFFLFFTLFKKKKIKIGQKLDKKIEPFNIFLYIKLLHNLRVHTQSRTKPLHAS
jgi:hypothetical protein